MGGHVVCVGMATCGECLLVGEDKDVFYSLGLEFLERSFQPLHVDLVKGCRIILINRDHGGLGMIGGDVGVAESFLAWKVADVVGGHPRLECLKPCHPLGISVGFMVPTHREDCESGGIAGGQLLPLRELFRDFLRDPHVVAIDKVACEEKEGGLGAREGLHEFGKDFGMDSGRIDLRCTHISAVITCNGKRPGGCMGC